jgi:DNA-binding response OmpR family regulator
MKKRILVAEDDSAILTGLIDLLEGEGYDVTCATDGTQALRLYEREKPQLMLLDVMMPHQSGYDVCRTIRARDKVIPILMLTAKGQEVDKVVGLELGADDFIVKPFGVNELLARIRAALRRVSVREERADDTPIEFGNVCINPKTLRGIRGTQEFEVTQREVRLLQEFAHHPGEVLDRNTLLDRVWGVRYEGTTRTLDQHIAKLRQKVEEDPGRPRYILTVHGAGYRFANLPPH